MMPTVVMLVMLSNGVFEKQVLSSSTASGLAMIVPAGQAARRLHMGWVVVFVNVPDGQNSQLLSSSTASGLVMRMPAGQTARLAHDFWLCMSVKVPAVQVLLREGIRGLLDTNRSPAAQVQNL